MAGGTSQTGVPARARSLAKTAPASAGGLAVPDAGPAKMALHAPRSRRAKCPKPGRRPSAAHAPRPPAGASRRPRSPAAPPPRARTARPAPGRPPARDHQPSAAAPLGISAPPSGSIQPPGPNRDQDPGAAPANRAALDPARRRSLDRATALGRRRWRPGRAARQQPEPTRKFAPARTVFRASAPPGDRPPSTRKLTGLHRRAEPGKPAERGSARAPHERAGVGRLVLTLQPAARGIPARRARLMRATGAVGPEIDQAWPVPRTTHSVATHPCSGPQLPLRAPMAGPPVGSSVERRFVLPRTEISNSDSGSEPARHLAPRSATAGASVGPPGAMWAEDTCRPQSGGVTTKSPPPPPPMAVEFSTLQPNTRPLVRRRVEHVGTAHRHQSHSCTCRAPVDVTRGTSPPPARARIPVP